MNIIGTKIKSWTVKEKCKIDGKKNYYRCVCRCNNERYFRKDHIKTGTVAKCDLCEKEEILEKNFEEFNRFYTNANGRGLDVKLVDIDEKYQLQCDKKHKFTTSIRKYNGCPKCDVNSKSKKTTDENYNFKNYYEYESKFWDYEKNRLAPDEVKPNSKRYYHFICEKGHEFSKSPSQIKNGSWCEECNKNKNNKESKLAIVIKNICKEIFDDVKFEHEFPIKTYVYGKETTLYPDIIVEDIKLNIEIHGSQHFKFTPHWHKTRSDFLRCKERDKKKKETLEKMGYYQIVIPATNNLNADISRFEEILRRVLHL